jgi:hypothetical protein
MVRQNHRAEQNLVNFILRFFKLSSWVVDRSWLLRGLLCEWSRFWMQLKGLVEIPRGFCKEEKIVDVVA